MLYTITKNQIYQKFKVYRSFIVLLILATSAIIIVCIYDKFRSEQFRSLENLLQNFTNEVTLMEAQVFYTFQAMMENIHAETYSLLIDTFIKDNEEKTNLFNALETVPCVKKKAEWALRWIETAPLFRPQVGGLLCR